MSSVQSIERAFAILDAVASHPEGLGVTEIAARVGLPKSTVSRLLGTLEGLTAVSRQNKNDHFQIGSGVMSLVVRLPFQQNLVLLARPFLLRLAEQVGEDVGLCIPDGDSAFYVDQVRHDGAVQVKDWTGTRLPLHVVTSGRLFLAARADRQVERYVKRPLTPYGPGTPTDPAQLWQRLQQIRETGYDWSLEEFAPGLNAVAVPVQNGDGEMVASITLFGPSFRFPAGEPAAVVALAQQTAEQISAQLGVYVAKTK